MATPTMLQQRNSNERAIKLRENGLTLQRRLTSLNSSKAGFCLLGFGVGLLRRAARILPLACMMLAGGCATAPGGGSSAGGLTQDSPIETKRAVLTQRINARWDALIKGDLDTAYTYMSEASKATYPLNVYKSKTHPGMWRSVKIDAIDCDATVCWAKMVLTYDHPRMKGVQTPLSESWIIEKGNAWFVYQPS